MRPAPLASEHDVVLIGVDGSGLGVDVAAGVGVAGWTCSDQLSGLTSYYHDVGQRVI